MIITDSLRKTILKFNKSIKREPKFIFLWPIFCFDADVCVGFCFVLFCFFFVRNWNCKSTNFLDKSKSTKTKIAKRKTSTLWNELAYMRFNVELVRMRNIFLLFCLSVSKSQAWSTYVYCIQCRLRIVDEWNTTKRIKMERNKHTIKTDPKAHCSNERAILSLF